MWNWAPETWGDFGVVGIVVFVAATFYVSLLRGWLVLGRNHTEVVAGKDEAIDRLNARSGKDAETIHTLSQAIIEKNATEDATTRILSALRDAIGSGGT